MLTHGSCRRVSTADGRWTVANDQPRPVPLEAVTVVGGHPTGSGHRLAKHGCRTRVLVYEDGRVCLQESVPR